MTGVLIKRKYFASCRAHMISFLILTCMTVFREDEDRDDETDSGRESSAYVKPDIEELEMLVEAYFVQIDGTLNKLSHVIYLYSASYTYIVPNTVAVAFTSFYW